MSQQAGITLNDIRNSYWRQYFQENASFKFNTSNIKSVFLNVKLFAKLNMI